MWAEFITINTCNIIIVRIYMYVFIVYLTHFPQCIYVDYLHVCVCTQFGMM